MEICMVAGEYPPGSGGVGVYVQALSKELSAQNMHVTVLTRGDDREVREERDEATVYRLPIPKLYPIHVFFHSALVREHLRSHWRDYDIVNVHAPLVGSVGREFRYILTQHGTVRSLGLSTKVTGFLSLGHRISTSLYSRIERELVDSASVVTCVSEATRRDLQRYYQTRLCKYVGNAVDECFVAQDPLRCEDSSGESYDVLFVGRLEPSKGVDLLIRAIALLHNKGHRVRLAIVGKGREEGRLSGLCRMAGLTDSVHFLGHLSDRTELLRLYETSSVFVLPSYYEGLPTVLLEAMARGSAVVATDIGGVSELIDHMSTGVKVPKGNSQALAMEIEHLLADPALRRDLGRSAREKIVREYRWPIVARRYRDIYLSSLENGVKS